MALRDHVLSGVHNVVFDLGGVLVEWDPESIVAAVFEAPQVQAAVRRAVFEHPDWLALDRGTLSEEEAVARFARRAAQPAAAMRRLMDQVRVSLAPKADALALLEELDERGVPLYCLSNMHVRNIAYLQERYDFFRRFRGMVISAQVRMIKPEPEIFAHLLAACRLEAAHSVFVDDYPANVAAARVAGLHSVLFTSAAECRRQLQALLGNFRPPS